MRRDDPERRSDAPRRDRSARYDPRLSVRTMMLGCAVVCALLLALAYGAAAIGDALETRVSLGSAAGGATFALPTATLPDANVSLALDAKPAALRGVSRQIPRVLR